MYSRIGWRRTYISCQFIPILGLKFAIHPNPSDMIQSFNSFHVPWFFAINSSFRAKKCNSFLHSICSSCPNKKTNFEDRDFNLRQATWSRMTSICIRALPLVYIFVCLLSMHLTKVPSKNVGVAPTSQRHRSPLCTIVHKVGQWCITQVSGAQHRSVVHNVDRWCTTYSPVALRWCTMSLSHSGK